jgi:hypothetical protein
LAKGIDPLKELGHFWLRHIFSGDYHRGLGDGLLKSADLADKLRRQELALPISFFQGPQRGPVFDAIADHGEVSVDQKSGLRL